MRAPMSKEIEEIETKIAEKEKELIKVKRELLDLRKQHPGFSVHDYTLTSTQGKEVSLSQLFQDKNELIVIHNMGKSCAYCTLWADGFNGFANHFESRAAFVLTSPDDDQTLAEFKQQRNWHFECVSTKGTTFKEDLGFKDEKGYVLPGVSILLKEEDGSIKHYTKAAFGPGDDYCSIWSLFDLLPDESKDWRPRLNYK